MVASECLSLEDTPPLLFYCAASRRMRSSEREPAAQSQPDPNHHHMATHNTRRANPCMFALAILSFLLISPQARTQPAFGAAAPGSGDVVISEIMFDPIDIDRVAGAEYVELYNRAPFAVRVAGWKICDVKPQATLPNSAPAIAPGSYLLVASDSAIYRRFPSLTDSSNVIVIGKGSFSFNADEDDVVLRDATGAAIDSVHYLDDWHRAELGEMKGVALERISMSGASNDRRNWSSSASPLGGTPAARNSIDIPSVPAEAAVNIFPSIFSPDGDGRDDFTRVICALPARSARIAAVAYDRWGRAVRRLAGNDLAAARSEIVWDGRDDDGRPLPPGIYVVRVEGYDDEGDDSFAAQGTVVIARRL
jgi:hypothetical protein